MSGEKGRVREEKEKSELRLLILLGEALRHGKATRLVEGH